MLSNFRTFCGMEILIPDISLGKYERFFHGMEHVEYFHSENFL